MSVARLLHFVPDFREHGLKELWVEFGVGEHRRHLPLHVMADRLGVRLSRVIVKAHVLMGDDAVSKIGTKHASLVCEPQEYLSDFGESN